MYEGNDFGLFETQESIAVYVTGKRAGSIVASTEDGTSASTPLFASVITRINGLRSQAGKKPSGFLNPLFYGRPQMFTDITSK